jgi:hypothetical protein
MYPYDIIFTLNNTQKFIVELDDFLEKLPCFCQTPIIFFNNKQKLYLSHDSLPDDIINLRTLLTKALNNELPLHKSITDIGYSENMRCAYEEQQILAEEKNSTYQWEPNPNVVYIQEDSYPSWVGEAYRLWGYQNIIAWIYNDSSKNIIFTITPRYPDFFTEDSNSIKESYGKWIQSYQPIITQVISPQVAQQWINQADKIINFIENKWTAADNEIDKDAPMTYEDCPRNM